MTRKRIYVAGPFSCEGRCEPLGVELNNMRRGLEMSVSLLNLGYAPFTPWLDYLFALVRGGEELTRTDYYDYSMAWLEAADAVFVVDVKEGSIGTLAEIKRAKELGIPVFYRLGELLEAM